MPRTARIVVPGIPHHMTQRGNNRQTVFFLDDDYRAYLCILAERTKKYGVEILGYCFMTNHVHLVAVPENEDALARPWAARTASTRSTHAPTLRSNPATAHAHAIPLPASNPASLDNPLFVK